MLCIKARVTAQKYIFFATIARLSPTVAIKIGLFPFKSLNSSLYLHVKLKASVQEPYFLRNMDMQKSWNLLWAVLVTFVLTACSARESATTAVPTVRLTTVAPSGTAQTSLYPGRTKASETINMAFKVSGTLQRVPVRSGDYVRRGQLIAQMDDRDYRLQLDATEAEYRQVKAEAERVIALYNDSGTTANNYDKARYGLEQITAKYNNHKNQLADTRLTAPFDGYVQEVICDEHETVAAGMPVLKLFSAGGTEVVINIPASEFQQKERISGFTCTFDVLPGRTFPLKLINVASKANANQLYETRLLLEGAHPEITPGMTAMVTIAYAPQEADKPLVSVPSRAVFDDGEGASVYVYDAATGTIRRRAVQVSALHTDGTTDITAGLQVGEEVVTAGVHHLTDGQAVTPMAAPSPTNVGGLL
jgi:RND family efflux transporter MFP subunit